ncbi:MAG TPA: TRAP transporter TatT component family protein [Myxococcales bacterium]|jgi:predicted anti-sigma-YlaC factor YlaD|nr:TRAP transporter TatT component family protein [Myxococcales bacterium]
MALALAACSPRGYALRQVAEAISSTGEGSVLGRDDDPDLVRDAVPFALKTMESLADRLPDHVPLRLAMARGFTQYGYAFVQQDADESPDPEHARALRDRAARLYLRARGYGLEGLRLARGITEDQLRGKEPARTQALSRTSRVDVPILYWTMAAWGGAISQRKTDMELVGDIPTVAAMLDRGLALDEAYELGVLHEFAISFDPARPEGTTPEKQRAHFARARELQKGKKISALVTYAESVAGPAQDRKSFEALLREALQFDVDAPQARDERLENKIAQRRARFLLTHESDILSD